MSAERSRSIEGARIESKVSVVAELVIEILYDVVVVCQQVRRKITTSDVVVLVDRGRERVKCASMQDLILTQSSKTCFKVVAFVLALWLSIGELLRCCHKQDSARQHNY